MRVDRLGEVTVPSGTLLVVDCGLLGLWSHDQPPILPPGFVGPAETEAANSGSDYRIVGPDAERVGRGFGRQWHPSFVYDVPGTRTAKTEASFSELVESLELSARLEACPQRVSHLERVGQALEHGQGGGEVFFHGATGVAVRVPADRALRVQGVRTEDDPTWERIELVIDPTAEETAARMLGRVSVDWARLLLADVQSLGAWQHEVPVDGLADYVFWGRDAAQLAKTIDGPYLGDGEFGWRDLPAEDAAEHGLEVERVRDAKGFKLAGDFRPHSHHWQLLSRMRSSPTDSGTLALDGATVCGLFTRCGDGVFPVVAVQNADDHLVAVRIQLRTPA